MFLALWAAGHAAVGVGIWCLWVYDGYIQHRIEKQRRRATPWTS